MTIEIRPLTQEEMKQFDEVLRIGFSSPPPARGEPDRPPEVLPEWTLCAFEDGELATTYAAFPFEMYFNGGLAPAAGVTAVSTLPWQRRRGHLRRIMETDFNRMHDQGGPAIAILYASMAAIYQRFGYNVVSTHLRYQVEPRFIEFTAPEQVRGRMRRFSRDDLSHVQPVYDAFAARRTGYLKRTGHVWQHMTFGYGPEQPLSVAYEEDGATLGYLVYWAEFQRRDGLEFGGNVRVSVGDLIWQTPAAYQALWDYLRRIDLARQIVVWRAPSDDPAPHLFLEPRMLHAVQQDGLLARIVDVERAIPQRHYAGEGRLTFEIRDEMCEWNGGRWEMETDGPNAGVRRTVRAPEVTMPVNTLAALLFGHWTATQAARIGRLTVHEPDALRRWDVLLRTEFPPACANMF